MPRIIIIDIDLPGNDPALVAAVQELEADVVKLAALLKLPASTSTTEVVAQNTHVSLDNSNT